MTGQNWKGELDILVELLGGFLHRAAEIAHDGATWSETEHHFVWPGKPYRKLMFWIQVDDIVTGPPALYDYEQEGQVLLALGDSD